jgi:hypothetical protein
MQNNNIYTVGFRVQKYGTAEKQDNYTQNVFEDDVFDATVFDFGIGMSAAIFQDNLFESGLFELEI